MKQQILDFLTENNTTWKIVEIAHAIGVPYDEHLLGCLLDLAMKNEIDMGGYESDPDHWKFVRLHTDKFPGLPVWVNPKLLDKRKN